MAVTARILRAGWPSTNTTDRAVERTCVEADPRWAATVNLEKVVFGFFVLLSATLNFGFFVGPISDARVHNVYELFLAVIVNLIATVLRFGDRT